MRKQSPFEMNRLSCPRIIDQNLGGHDVIMHMRAHKTPLTLLLVLQYPAVSNFSREVKRVTAVCESMRA